MEQRGRPRSSDRILIEECCSVLSAASLSGSRCKESGGYPQSITITATWPESGEHFDSIIRVTHTLLPTGGRRLWLLCPVCERRSGRLYLPTDAARRYACRLCLNAAYDCQYRKNRPDWFRHLLRSQKRNVSRIKTSVSTTELPSHIQSLFNRLSDGLR